MAARKKTKAKTAAKKKAVAKTVKKAAKKSKPAKAKAPARKAAKPVKAGATKNKKKAPAKKKKQIVGEGDYAASRAFLKDQTGFVQKNKAKIPALGKQARAALEGSEGPSLLAAEAEARSHSKTGSEE